MMTFALREVTMPKKRNFSLPNRYIPKRSGVYIVHDEEGNVLDVGESAKVGQRISTHERRTCWRENAVGAVGIHVVWTPGKKKAGRRAVERQLRDEFDPDCGDR
jgi:hypothetical protein